MRRAPPAARVRSRPAISASSAGEFIAPAGSVELRAAMAAPRLARRRSRPAASAPPRSSPRPGALASTSQTRQTPVKTLSWMRKPRAPVDLDATTSPSPSIWLVTRARRREPADDRGAGRAPSPSGSQRRARRGKRASTSRASPTSASGSARSGTRGISKVFISRGIARKCELDSSSGCDPGPTIAHGNRETPSSRLLLVRLRHAAARRGVAAADRDADVGGRVGAASSSAPTRRGTRPSRAGRRRRRRSCRRSSIDERRPAPEAITRRQLRARLRAGARRRRKRAGERAHELGHDHREVERLLELRSGSSGTRAARARVAATKASMSSAVTSAQRCRVKSCAISGYDRRIGADAERASESVIGSYSSQMRGQARLAIDEIGEIARPDVGLAPASTASSASSASLVALPLRRSSRAARRRGNASTQVPGGLHRRAASCRVALARRGLRTRHGPWPTSMTSIGMPMHIDQRLGSQARAREHARVADRGTPRSPTAARARRRRARATGVERPNGAPRSRGARRKAPAGELGRRQRHRFGQARLDLRAQAAAEVRRAPPAARRSASIASGTCRAAARGRGRRGSRSGAG